jgi:uncharacterized protein with HEPN domain
MHNKNRSAKLYIEDVLKYIEKIELFTNNFTYEDFLQDDKTCYAVIRCIEVIGEASKNIPENIKSQYSFIPWNDIIGMRNKIVHGYFDTDYEVVWATIKIDIPKLKPLIEQILKDYKTYNN